MSFCPFSNHFPPGAVVSPRLSFAVKFIFDIASVTIMISPMKLTLGVVALFTVALLMGTDLAGQAAQGTRPGKLIVWGDLALFQPPNHPEGCTLRNRFKR